MGLGLEAFLGSIRALEMHKRTALIAEKCPVNVLVCVLVGLAFQ